MFSMQYSKLNTNKLFGIGSVLHELWKGFRNHYVAPLRPNNKMFWCSTDVREMCKLLIPSF